MTKLDPALWRDMMDYLRERHATICRQWFETLRPVKIDSGLLRIYTDTDVQRNYLQKRCVEQFQEAAQSATGALVAVRFEHDADDSIALSEPIQSEPDHRGNGDGKTIAAVEQPKADQQHQSSESNSKTQSLTTASVMTSPANVSVGRVPPTPTLNHRTIKLPSDPLFPDDPTYDQVVLCPDYSFETFVNGPNARLAHAASVAVANQPGNAYNPLFIHGGVGLGKTHLLQAVCQTILEQHPDFRICYLSCDAFMNQFLECVQRGLMNEFRQRYRMVDVLVIDDVHFLAKRESSQEEFFHTFNALYQNNRQIVLSSDSPPGEIPDLEERLVSRFQWGLVANITKPSFETRVAIVKSKSKIRGIELPDEVVNYISTKFENNARELEGAITTTQGYAAMTNRPITLDLVREALGDPASDAKSSQVTLQHIIDVVTDFYHVKLSDLQSKRRHKSITEPRQVCMYLARKRTRFSLQEIGGYFGGRDHTTVMHSIRTVEQRGEEELEFAQQLAQLDQRIDSAR